MDGNEEGDQTGRSCFFVFFVQSVLRSPFALVSLMSAWDYVSLEAPTRVARRALVTVLGAALCGGAALMASMRSHHNTFQNKASP
eukprot:g72236.t1